jgi:urease accessory protein
MRTEIRLGVGATLEWRDETVLGRHEEAPGSLLHRVRIDRDGSALLRSDVALGPRWPETLGAGGIDGARAVGTRLVVGAAPADRPIEVDGARAAVLPIGPDAAVVSAVGGTAWAVRRALHGAPLCTREGFVST